MNPELIVRANEVSAAWGEAIWRATWQGAVAALVVWIICRVWRRIPNALRCGLWWLVCLKMLTALSPLSVGVPVYLGTSTIDLSQAPKGRNSTAQGVSPGFDAPRVASPVGAGSREALWSAALERRFAARQTSESSVRAIRRQANLSPAVSLVAVWSVGALGFGLIGLRDLRRTRKLVGEAATPSTGLSSAAEEVAAAMGFKTPPTIRVTGEAISALTVGAWRPTVLLSDQALSICSPEELRLLLAHEFAHIRRLDAWLALVPQAAQVLFFFHPAAWLACREFNLGREASCDEIAITTLNTGSQALANLLLKFGAGQKLGAPLCTPGVSSHYRLLDRRITMLSNATFSPTRRLGLRAMALTCLAIPMCFATLRPTELKVSTLHDDPPKGVLRTTVTKANLRTSVANAKPTTRSMTSHKGGKVDTKGWNHRAPVAPEAKPAAQTPTATQVFQITTGEEADDVAKLLRQVFRPGGVDDVSIVVDERSNSIIGHGSVSAMRQLADLVGRLMSMPRARHRSRPFFPPETKVLPLSLANADSVAKIVRGSFGIKDASEAKVVADSYSNAIIITGPADKVGEMTDLVRRLDVPAPPSHQSREFFKLQHASAQAAAGLLQDFVDRGEVAVLKVDERNNTLVVSGSMEKLKEVEKAVRELDKANH